MDFVCKKALLLCCLLIFSLHLFSQEKKLTKEEQNMLSKAEFFFKEKKYNLALPLYLELEEIYHTEVFLKYRIGSCYLNTPNEIAKAVFYLEFAYASEPTLVDILLDLGIAYLKNYEFNEAIDKLNLYLKHKVPPHKAQEANLYIANAKNGIKIIAHPINYAVKKIDTPLNSEFVEYGPLVAPDESFMIFTYRGEQSTGGLQNVYIQQDVDGMYYEDIFISFNKGNGWEMPESISDSINTNQHDAAIALSKDGQKLFIYRSSKKVKGDIYVCSRKNETWSLPESLGKNINSKHWEGSCALSNDETILYFSSERPGGFGGKDIYRSRIMPDGKWGKAENLGPKINTAFDEDGPFIHANDTTLFFSSQGHNSMGGYDIFSSNLMSKDWSYPENLGYPINTTSDDIFYVRAGNSETAYYSSSKSGNFDIYSVAPSDPKVAPVLALVLDRGDGNEKQDNLTVPYESPKEFEGKDLKEDMTYNSIIQKFGKLENEDIKYKVQIGAYRYPENFNYKDLQELGFTDLTVHPDGIKRFTMREFSTLADAEAFRQEIIRKGIKDAWIIAFYRNERKLLQEIIDNNFFKEKAL